MSAANQLYRPGSVVRSLFAALLLWCVACPTKAQTSAALAASPVIHGHQLSATVFHLAPFAHARFCVEHREQCVTSRRTIRKANIRMTPARLAELQQINTVVNSQIRPQADAPGLLGDRWQINVSRGDCDDYAVTKRARLLAAGWNSRSLLLAAAVLPDGQDHLVLVVRTTSGDIVLDNMAKTPKPVASVGYRWTALQDEMNPLYWRRIDPRRPLLAVAPLPPMQPNVRVATATAPFDVAAAPVALRGTIIR